MVKLKITTHFLLVFTASALALKAQASEILRVGMVDELGIQNPISVNYEDLKFSNAPLYKYLLEINSKGHWKCYACKKLPDVKELYKRFKAKDRISFEMQIDTKRKWGDGKSLSVQDILFSWKVFKIAKQNDNRFDPSFIIESIVKGNAPHSFIVTLKDYRVDLLDYLQFPIIRASIEQPILFQNIDKGVETYFENSSYRTTPTRKGLYLSDMRLTKFSPNEIEIVTGEKASKKMIIKSYSSIDRVLSDLALDKIDIIADLNYLNHVDSYETWKKKIKNLGREFTILKRKIPTLELIHFNAKNPRFLDDELKNTIYAALGGLNYLGKQSNIPNVVYNADKFNVAPIKKVPLKKAQIKGPNKSRTVKMKLVSNKEQPYRQDLVKAIKGNLGDYGIKISSSLLSDSEFENEIISKNDYKDLLLISWRLPITSIPFNLFHSDEIPFKSVNHTGQNLSNYANVELDRLIDSVLRSEGFHNEEKKIQQVYKLLSSSKPIIPLFFHEQVLIYRKSKIKKRPRFVGATPSSLFIKKLL